MYYHQVREGLIRIFMIILVIFALFTILSIFYQKGYNNGKEEMKHRAINAHVGKYAVDDKTGVMTFTFTK